MERVEVDKEPQGAFWSFERDGEEFTIAVTSTYRGVPTRADKACMLVLDGLIDGERRSVWCWPANLYQQLLDELDSRDTRDFEHEEPIRIRRGEEIPSKRNPGWRWRKFHVTFLRNEAVDPSTAEIPF